MSRTTNRKPGSVREFEREVLARIVATTNGDHDVLFAVQHVGHGRSALRRGHPHGAHLMAGNLIVCSQHRPRGWDEVVVT
jgi:hypothetical protein